MNLFFNLNTNIQGNMPDIADWQENSRWFRHLWKEVSLRRRWSYPEVVGAVDSVLLFLSNAKFEMTINAVGSFRVSNVPSRNQKNQKSTVGSISDKLSYRIVLSIDVTTVRTHHHDIWSTVFLYVLVLCNHSSLTIPQIRISGFVRREWVHSTTSWS